MENNKQEYGEFLEIQDYETLDKNYYTCHECRSISQNSLSKVRSYIIPKNLRIDRFECSRRCYLKAEVDKVCEKIKEYTLEIQDYETLEKNYYTLDECCSKLDINKKKMSSYVQIKSYILPKHLKVGKFKGLMRCYLKSDVDKVVNEMKKESIDITQAMKILDITRSQMCDIINEFNLGLYKKSYLKSDIEKIYELQQEFFLQYMTLDEVKKILSERCIAENLTNYNLPTYAQSFGGGFRGKRRAYNKCEVEQLILSGFAKDSYYKENNIKIDGYSLEEYKIAFNDFFKEHYTNEKVLGLLNDEYIKMATPIEVPNSFKRRYLKNVSTVYNKKEIDKLVLLQANTEINSTDLIENRLTAQEVIKKGYIKFDIACEMLEVDIACINQLSKDALYDVKRIGTDLYILKSSIEDHIKEFESFSSDYYTLMEVSELIKERYRSKIEKVEVPLKFKIMRFAKSKHVYLKSDVDKVYLLNNMRVSKAELIIEHLVEEGYIKSDIACEMLGVDRDRLQKLSKYASYDSKKIGIHKYILKSDIENHIEEFKFFSDNYYTPDEINKITGGRYKGKIDKIRTPLKFKMGKFISCNYVYLKSDCDKLNLLENTKKFSGEHRKKIESAEKNKQRLKIAIEKGYIRTDIACRMLDISKDQFKRVFKHTSYDSKKIGIYRYILKSDIENYIKEFKFFSDNYYTPDEINKGIGGIHKDELNKIKTPLKFKIGKFTSCIYVYSKFDFDKYNILGDDITLPEDIKVLTDTILPEDVTAQKDIVVPRERKYFTTLSEREQNVLKNKLMIETLIKEGYVKTDVASEMLGITKGRVYKIVEDASFNTKRVGKVLYILKSDIENHLKEFELFCETYYTLSEARELLKVKYINSINLPPKFRLGKFNYAKCACLKSKVDELYSLGYEYKHLEDDKALNEYYDRDTTAKILRLSKKDMTKKLNDVGIHGTKYGKSLLFKKVEVDRLKELQDEFVENYFTLEEAVIVADNHIGWLKDLDMCIKIQPAYQIDKFEKNYNAYPKKEFLKYVKDKQKYEEFSQPFYSEDVSLEFRKKLEVYPGYKFNVLCDKYPLATKLILQYWDSKLISSNATLKNKNVYVRMAVRIVYRVYDMIEEYSAKDIYALKTTQILEFLLTIEEKSYREEMVCFLEYVHGIITYKLNHEKNTNKKVFDIVKIISKFKERNNKKELLNANIYDIDTFSELLKYCQDVNLHTKNSLEAFRLDDKPRYVSLWLTVTINANNGWRIEDISNLPKINITDLLDEFGIFNLDWFKENTLSLDQSILILGRLYNHEYIINKTQENNGFFVSVELTPSVATAYAILTLYTNSETLSENNERYSNDIMRFFSDFNYPLNHFFEIFFNDFKVEEFKYSSNRVTSTLLTFLEAIKIEDQEVEEIVDNAEMLMKLRSNIRGHKKVMSTLNYLNQNPEKLDRITRNLFRRGEFGYIYSTIANELGLNIKKIARPDGADEVCLLPEITNNVWDIEIASGILNSIDKNRKSVLGKIHNMNFKQILKKFNDIVKSKYPSRVKGVKCFVGHKNCEYKDKDCLICENAIVTVYALNTIAKGLVSLLLEYHTTNFIGEKIKISYSIEYYTCRIKEAIEVYGADVVYAYMQLKREDVWCLLNEVKDVKQLYEER